MKTNDKPFNGKAVIAPSLICADLCNLERDVKRMERMGCSTLHVDVLDGYFSPSMPIGLDTIRQLRSRTTMCFDAHVMARKNAFFVDELIDIGAERICFQLESEQTPGPLLHKIRAAGLRAGVALAPSTPISQLELIIEECDHVLLMQIDPGYASFSSAGVAPYMERKFEELARLIEKRNPAATITVDGRVGFETMERLRRLGVTTFVSGTRGLFSKGDTWENNWKRMNAILSGEEC